MIQRPIRSILAVLFLIAGAGMAQAQTVTFKSIHDAVPFKFFDAATTVRDPANHNKLVIGLNTGFDPTTFLTAQFVAFDHRTAMDTISFLVNAPVGYYIAKIVYNQRGAGSTCRTCSSAGAATWVVNGHPANLGVFTNNPTLSGSADVTALKLTSVPVSITDSLFATTGSVMITGADVTVTVIPR
jgi:hypothetical protein